MDLIESGARNMVAWLNWQLRAHGLECSYSDSLWSCREIFPRIFLTAVTLSPGPSEDNPELMQEIEQLAAQQVSDNIIVCDWWASLDLARLGFEPDPPEPIYFRPPGHEPQVPVPPELKIEQVTDAETLEAFEEASVEGFEAQDIPGRSRWHVPTSLGDPNMGYYFGRVAGQIASVSIGCVSDGVVGIYGVATPPAFRRRGYGAALSWAAIQAAAHLPAILEPSDMATPMYRRMGFTEISQFRHWRRKRDAS